MKSTLVGMALLSLAPPQSPQPSPPAIPLRHVMLLENDFEQLAIELAAKPDLVAISLDADGSHAHGLVFDRFMLGVLDARAQIAAGKRPTPTGAVPGRGLLPARTIVVAFPLTCKGATVAPLKVEILNANSAVLQNTATALHGAELQAALPGVTLPDGALGMPFAISTVQRNTSARITYAGPACPANAPTAMWPFTATNIPLVASTRVDLGKLPAEMASAGAVTIHVHGLLGADGALRNLTALDGPLALEEPARLIAATWRFKPPMMNGTFTPTGLTLSILLTADGTLPEGRRPEGLVSAAGVAASGNSPADTGSTPVTEGLTVAKSACGVSSDGTYGVTIENPVGVGGGDMAGAQRGLTYLRALRGPQGESVSYRRVGSLPDAHGTFVLDAYELTFTGIARPVRVYIDDNHWDEPEAPQGFACGVPIGLAKIGG
jgi:hypothetical protein